MLGWATLGLIGFGAGSAVGGLVAIVKKPQNYDYAFIKLLILIVFCGAITALVLSVLTKLSKKLSRLIATDEAVELLEIGDKRSRQSLPRPEPNDSL